MKKYNILLLLMLALLTSCNEESFIEGISFEKESDFNNITNKVILNGVSYEIENAYKTNFVRNSCKNTDVIGGLNIICKAVNNKSIEVIFQNFKNYEISENMNQYVSTTCNIQLFIRETDLITKAVKYYDSTNEGTLKLNSSLFNFKNGKVKDVQTGTNVSLLCSGTYF